MTKIDEMNAVELRAFVGGRYPGRSGEIRKLKKDQLAQMIRDDWDLDKALATFVDEPITNGRPDDPLGTAILNAIMTQLPQNALTPDMDKIREMISHEVEEQIESVRRVSIEVELPTGVKNIGTQHHQFETLLKMVSAGVNVLMVGPAGSGKTYTAREVARALDKRFFSASVGPQSSKVDFMGYMDANGRYVRTNWREAFENGGVFLIDELDAGNPQILTTINQTTENGTAGFPDGQVERHADFIVLASGNTYGRGADRMYVGRQQLDGATNDRFAILNWEYDEVLEREITGNDQWVKRVQTIRKAVEKLKIRHIVSPRASINGARLLATGIPREQVEEMLIWKGLDETQKTNIVNNL